MREFNPQLEIFNPFVEPFSNPEKADVVFDQREMDACCACTAYQLLCDEIATLC